jgi:hypothetical protein
MTHGSVLPAHRGFAWFIAFCSFSPGTYGPIPDFESALCRNRNYASEKADRPHSRPLVFRSVLLD